MSGTLRCRPIYLTIQYDPESHSLPIETQNPSPYLTPPPEPQQECPDPFLASLSAAPFASHRPESTSTSTNNHADLPGQANRKRSRTVINHARLHYRVVPVLTRRRRALKRSKGTKQPKEDDKKAYAAARRKLDEWLTKILDPVSGKVIVPRTQAERLQWLEGGDEDLVEWGNGPRLGTPHRAQASPTTVGSQPTCPILQAIAMHHLTGSRLKLADRLLRRGPGNRESRFLWLDNPFRGDRTRDSRLTELQRSRLGDAGMIHLQRVKVKALETDSRARRASGLYPLERPASPAAVVALRKRLFKIMRRWQQEKLPKGRQRYMNFWKRNCLSWEIGRNGALRNHPDGKSLAAMQTEEKLFRGFGRDSRSLMSSGMSLDAMLAQARGYSMKALTDASLDALTCRLRARMLGM